MDKENLTDSKYEFSGYSENRLNKAIDDVKDNNIKGSILFSLKPVRKKKSYKWSRIRSFLINDSRFKRPMEFSCHPGGIHLLRLAVFHSENGCKMCKVYVEKNLF